MNEEKKHSEITDQMIEDFIYFSLYEKNRHAQERFESGQIAFKIDCKGDGSVEDIELFKTTYKNFAQMVNECMPSTDAKFKEYTGQDQKSEITFILPPRFGWRD